VYVKPFPAGNDKSKISVAGGEQPRWRRDGKELFFVAEDGKMMAVAVKAAKASFEIVAQEPLFETHIVGLGALTTFSYDVNAEGKQFLVNTTAEPGSTPLTVVVTGPRLANELAGHASECSQDGDQRHFILRIEVQPEFVTRRRTRGRRSIS
jgi:hypothetical protein